MAGWAGKSGTVMALNTTLHGNPGISMMFYMQKNCRVYYERFFNTYFMRFNTLKPFEGIKKIEKFF